MNRRRVSPYSALPSRGSEHPGQVTDAEPQTENTNHENESDERNNNDE